MFIVWVAYMLEFVYPPDQMLKQSGQVVASKRLAIFGCHEVLFVVVHFLSSLNWGLAKVQSFSVRCFSDSDLYGMLPLPASPVPLL